MLRNRQNRNLGSCPCGTGRAIGDAKDVHTYIHMLLNSQKSKFGEFEDSVVLGLAPPHLM